MPGVGERYLSVLLVDRVIVFLDERCGDTGEPCVERFGIGDGRRNDQRRPCFVDQDGVDLVDDGKMVTAVFRQSLAKIARFVFEVVAQIIETELVVGAVGDIGGIRFAATDRPQKIMLTLKLPSRVLRPASISSVGDMRRIVEV